MLLVYVPPLLAAFVAYRWGFRRALVFVALPVLLLLPTPYAHKVAGIPAATFFNYAFLVTLSALALGRDRALVRPSAIDALVGVYALLVVASEHANKDFSEAQNMAARILMGTVAPYAFGRAAAARDGLLVAVIAMLVALGAVVGLASPYEARFGQDLFDDWLRSSWPEPLGFTRAMYRNGLRRVEGPFSQPICQGLYFAMTAPLLLWLVDARLLAHRGARWVAVVTFAAGLLLTQARGPIMGCALALAVTRASWSPRRATLLLATVAAVGLGVAASWETMRASWFVTRAEATSEEQHSAAYRFEMLQNYMELVEAEPWQGYGRNQIPVVKGQDSIDNQYLFLSLTHGLPAAVAYLALLLVPAIAAARAALRRPVDDARARLALALAASIASTALVQVTVYAGTQSEQVLLLLVGAAVTLASRMEAEAPGRSGLMPRAARR